MTNNWMKIAEWIENSKKAKLVDPPDDGRPVRTGERYSEHSQDIKSVTGQHNVDSAAENPESGRSDNFGEGHGLQQVTADKKIKGQEKIKVVHDANLKASQVIAKGEEATLDELVEAVDSLRHAFETFKGTSTKRAGDSNFSYEHYPTSTSVDNISFDNDFFKKASLDVVNEYMSYGKLNADVLYSFLSGFSNEYYNLKKAAREDNLPEYLAADPYTDPKVADMFRTFVKMAETGMADQILNTVTGPTASTVPPPETDKAPPSNETPPERAEDEKEITDEDFAAAAAELGLSPEDLMDLIRVIQERIDNTTSTEPTETPTETETEKGTEKETPLKEEGETTKTSSYMNRPLRLHRYRKRAAQREFAVVKNVIESTVDRMTSGNFRLKPAADGSAARIRREIAKQYLNELLNIAVS